MFPTDMVMILCILGLLRFLELVSSQALRSLMEKFPEIQNGFFPAANKRREQVQGFQLYSVLL
jgi:hypothetical protein